MSSIWDLVTAEREQEYQYASLAVEYLQAGRDASSFMERAGFHRAVYHDYRATCQDLEELRQDRLDRVMKRGKYAA